jgi:hypothetical protein
MSRCVGIGTVLAAAGVAAIALPWSSRTSVASGHTLAVEHSSTSTLAEILSAVNHRHEKIDRIDVKFTFKADSEDRSLIENVEARIITEGEKLFKDELLGFNSDSQDQFMARRVTSVFDGKDSYRIVHSLKSATVEPGSKGYIRTQGAGFFDLNMMNIDEPDVDGPNDQSLISTLQSMWTTVRPDVEFIGDAECVVVDTKDAFTGKVFFTAWLDPTKAYLPLKQKYFDPTNDSVSIEFTAHETHEPIEGVWFVTKGTKQIAWKGKTVKFDLAVSKTDSGQPWVLINQAEPVDPFSNPVPLGYGLPD